MSHQTSQAGPLPDLLRDLNSAQARIKLRASKSFRDLSRETPQMIYPHFDTFAALLDHDNNILKWNAILTLAHLASVDHEGKVERLLDHYLAPITGPVMITAANTIKGAAEIARFKPRLVDRIVAGILRVERAKYATQECRQVAIGHALQALGTMRQVIADPRSVYSFAQRQTSNPRSATARKAVRLLESLASE
jgi:hypothetical protein